MAQSYSQIAAARALRIVELQEDIERVRDTKSPLVQLVEAFEQLQRVQKYLYASTYASDGWGTMSWAHWYDNVASAIGILRYREQSLRHDIARRIGAKTIE